MATNHFSSLLFQLYSRFIITNYIVFMRSRNHYNQILQNENFQLKTQYNQIVSELNKTQLENNHLKHKLEVLENPLKIIRFLKQQNANLNREIINKNRIIQNMKNENKFNLENLSIISPAPIDQFPDNISDITNKSVSTSSILSSTTS